MEIIRDICTYRKRIQEYRRPGVSIPTIGFVPTMGCLHDGHMALINHSVHENQITVVSIFVNPTQFGPNVDFDTYPRTLQHDAALCEISGVDIIFAPKTEEIYPTDYFTTVSVKTLAKPLCGASRPKHFDGVTTIVLKLFNIITPNRAYFGQKDGQQVAVIQRMVLDLNLDIEVCVLSTVREADGLAMSSRNTYLSSSSRERASVIFKALSRAEKLFLNGERRADVLINAAMELLNTEPEFTVQYLECRYFDTMKTVSAKINRQAMIAVAGTIEKVRLIDNILLDP